MKANNFDMTHIQQNLGTPVPNWTPRSRPSQAKLSGQYCCLELLNLERHGLALFNASALAHTPEFFQPAGHDVAQNKA